jgi:hypothetical protein
MTVGEMTKGQIDCGTKQPGDKLTGHGNIDWYLHPFSRKCLTLPLRPSKPDKTLCPQKLRGMLNILA